MARITVEDCLEKIDSQYDLVLLAKERTSQLNAGDPSLVSKDNDKNTVISLREIGEGKVSVKSLEESAINKLRKKQEETTDVEDLDEENEDEFDKVYKGEISKSGTAILPSKRLRRIPEKNNISLQKKEEVQTDNSNLAEEKTDVEKEKVETDIKPE
jgi:DNA-directed RNA polymerase subunit omega